MKLPDFTLPDPVSRVGARLPQLPPTLLLTTTLNFALDRLLPREQLEPLTGKRLMIRVRDAGLVLRFTYGRYGFLPSFDPRTPDLVISARVRDFISLMTREEDPDTLFFSRRLTMEGETELGLQVKNTLDAIDLPRFDPRGLKPGEIVRRLRMTIGRQRRINTADL